MTLMMKKFVKLAHKNKVTIIGQITGANGKMLQDAIQLICPKFISRNYHTLSINDIEMKGLNTNDIGKIIIF
jgi:folate-dependent tRNA-U54 methylase TrmFO/GidA